MSRKAKLFCIYCNEYHPKNEFAKYLLMHYDYKDDPSLVKDSFCSVDDYIKRTKMIGVYNELDAET